MTPPSEIWTDAERARRVAVKCLECTKIVFVSELPAHLRLLHGFTTLEMLPVPKPAAAPNQAAVRIFTWLIVVAMAGLAFWVWRLAWGG